MRKFVSILYLLIILCGNLFAQDEENMQNLTIKGVMDAYIAMRDAAAVKDTVAMKSSARYLAEHGVCESTLISPKKWKGDNSLEGHLDFTNFYSDSLRAVRSERGQNADGSISSKTFFIKAFQKIEYVFPASGYQELGVVAEHGGLVTIKVRVSNASGFTATHDDRNDVKAGRGQRYKYFTMPDSPMSKVTLEVINCCNRDFSFVVVSN